MNQLGVSIHRKSNFIQCTTPTDHVRESRLDILLVYFQKGYTTQPEDLRKTSVFRISSLNTKIC